MAITTKALRGFTQDESLFRCANPDHWRLACEREELRLRDHRWADPPGRMPARDYCTSECASGALARVTGARAYCPLGGDSGHEWVAETVGRFVLSRRDLRP